LGGLREGHHDLLFPPLHLFQVLTEGSGTIIVKRGFHHPPSRTAAAAAMTKTTSKRWMSTEPVLENSAKPEVPKAPLSKPPSDSPDGSGPPKASEKVEKLCTEILELNMVELGSLLKVLKVW